MIKIQNLSVNYGEVSVLRDISLEIAQGEFVLVTGPSGCGKSTLARAICGLIPHALPAQIQGRVFVAGMDTQAHTLPELTQIVNLVFQNPASQLFHLSVQEEISFGPRNLGLGEDEVTYRVDWALKVTGLDALREDKPSELSGGQQQRVAIARALAMEPKVMLFDEPTSALDPEMIKEVLDVMVELAESGMTMLCVTHEMSFAREAAGRVLFMADGQILVDAPPARFFSEAEDERQASFLSKIL